MKKSILLMSLAAAFNVNANVIITEFTEGVSFNKAVEISNLGTSAVDLGAEGYVLKLYSNANIQAGKTLDLTGTLDPQESLVVYRATTITDSTSASIVENTTAFVNNLPATNIIESSDIANFNGNDAVELVNNAGVVDIVGQIGSGAYDTQDVTIRRNANITAGDIDGSDAFDYTTEWTVFEKSISTGLGCPGIDGCSADAPTDTPVDETPVDETPVDETPATASLIFTEYLEPTDYSQALEITNFTDTDIDLSKVVLKNYYNGNTDATGGNVLTLTGILPPYQSFTMVTGSANADVQALFDFVVPEASKYTFYFGGDDALALLYDGQLVDSIGKIGEQPDPAWSTDSASTKDSLLRRAEGIISGDINTADDVTFEGWVSIPADSNNDDANGGFSLNGFGCSGTADCPAKLLFTEYLEPTNYSQALEITNFTDNEIDLSKVVIKNYYNGNSEATGGNVLTLTGTLASGDSFTLVTGSANADVQALFDFVVPEESKYTFYFGGDDALELLYDGQRVDSIGKAGEQPDPAWSSDNASTKNSLLRRKNGVTSGDVDMADETSLATWLSIAATADDPYENGGFSLNGFGCHSVSDCFAIDNDDTTGGNAGGDTTGGNAGGNTGVVSSNLVLITEFTEGFSSNKAVEISNLGTSAVDLAAEGYVLKLYSNKNTTAGKTLDLTGTLAPQESLVVYQAKQLDDNTSASIVENTTAFVNNLPTTNVIESSDIANFNGNDAVELANNAGVVDIVGQIGSDAYDTQDVTIRRNANITSGDTDGSDAFDYTTEWTVFEKSISTGLGCPGVDVCSNGDAGTGNGDAGTGNGDAGTGNGDAGTGNGDAGTGNGDNGGDTVSGDLPKLLFTEYLVEAFPGGDKRTYALELTNVGDVTIDMSTITIAIHFNGINEVTDSRSVSALEGELGAGESYVLVHRGGDDWVQEIADFIPSQANQYAVSFNGNDVITILHAATITDTGVLADGEVEGGRTLITVTGEVIDSIGVIGSENQPPEGSFNWGVVDGVSLSDYTLRRENSGTPDTDITDTMTMTGWTQHDFTYNGLGCSGLADCPGLDLPITDEDATDTTDPDQCFFSSGQCNADDIPTKVKDIADYDESTYYANTLGADAADLAALRTAINTDIKAGFNSLTYSQVWHALLITDVDPNNADNVMTFFKGESVSKADSASVNQQTGWNREHGWPTTYGDFRAASKFGYTDLHHLRPSDASVNGAKSNKQFDFGGAPIEDDGVDTGNFVDSDSFEPRDAVKGDFARALMYMDVRYDGTDGNMLDLVLTVDLALEVGPAMGKLCTVLAWHNNDPVSDAEKARNDLVFELQGNRNPFVDYPAWADALYGDQCEGVDTGEPEPPADIVIDGRSIMITEYMAGAYGVDQGDGSGSNGIYRYGALEISNLSDTDIPFENIRLDIAFAGFAEESSSTIDLGMSGKVLAAGESHIITSVRAVEAIQELVADGKGTLMPENVAKFTGDDAFVLYLNNDMVDSFGSISGEDPGNSWTLGGLSSQGFALRRELTAEPEFGDAASDDVTFAGWVGFPYSFVDENDVRTPNLSGFGCAGIDACPVAYTIGNVDAQIDENTSGQIKLIGEGLENTLTWSVLSTGTVSDQLVLSGENTGTLTIQAPANVDEHTPVTIGVQSGDEVEEFDIIIVNADAPEITLTGESTYNVTEADVVKFVVESSKTDNVIFTWTQNDPIKLGAFNEPQVNDAGNVEFRAPFVSEPQSYTFTVVVGDLVGLRTASHDITLNVSVDPEQTPPESGSSGTMFILILGMLGIAIRRRVK